MNVLAVMISRKTRTSHASSTFPRAGSIGVALAVASGCGNVANTGSNVDELRGLAELTCAPTQTLAWDGTRWACVEAYTDQKAVAAVAASDVYVTKTGDSTITGNPR